MQAVNRLLLRADAFCIFDDTCPFHSQGKGSVVKVSSLFIESDFIYMKELLRLLATFSASRIPAIVQIPLPMTSALW